MSTTQVTTLAVRRVIEKNCQRMFEEIASLSESVYDRELFDIAKTELEKRGIVERFEGWYFGG